MSVYWSTIPTDFPLGYVFGSTDPQHIVYVKRRWPGLPGCTHAPGFLDGEWELGCVKPGCDDERTVVVSIEQLLAALIRGDIVGTYKNNLLTVAGVHGY